MTSYELIDSYEKILIKIEELEGYTKDLINLVNTVNRERDILLNLIYTSGINSTATNNAQRDKIITTMNKFILNFDVLGNHQQLIKIKGEIESILKEPEFPLYDQSTKIINILDQFSNITSSIYQYVKSRDISITVDLLNKASNIVNEYTKFVESYKTIKDFMSKTENKIENNENEKMLKLHFYDEHLKMDEYITNFTAVNQMYEIMCLIFGISSSEYQLRIVKIESGSLFENFLGAKSVIDAISLFFKKTVELVFNKYTFEGKVLRHKQILELLKEDAEVIEKYRELGIEIDFNNEDTSKLHYQLIKSIGNLVGRTTKVKVNNDEFCLENSLKQKYLTESNVLRIDSPKNGSEEIIKE